MEFRVLGPLEVVRDGAPIDLGGAKQRAVLVALLVRAGHVVSADRLAEDVWDGRPPAAAATTLRAYISNLRKALRPEDVLHTRPQGYQLEITGQDVDASRFEALANDGRKVFAADDSKLAAQLLTEALAAWRGRAYEEFAHTSFVQAEATRLEELKLNCIEDLIEARLVLGEHSSLTGELEALTATHPLRERLWSARMRALYGSGRQGDALMAYEEARRVLADELGVDPSPELRAVHESILRHDESLAASRPPARGSKQTLTFVFTDVELSTEMLIESEDEYAYASIIEGHRAALRDAFASHGGQRIRVWGDAFFAAFDTATDAVRAGLAAQLALHADESHGVRVRMGIHSGEAAIVADDYVGLAVHTAARIQSAAHGGQILVSQATRQLLDAIDDLGFVDLGAHQLKDIPETVQLLQVTHPELPRAFPAPRTLSGMPHNLPAQATSFVGREDDKDGVIEALERARIITLTGVGGVGKTRLAQEVGAELLPRYPDGVWLCELAPVTDLEGIVHTLGRAVRMRRSPMEAGGYREGLSEFLRPKRMLLLFDNCEHVLEPAAELIEDVVATCPDVSVLATSREGIGVAGEHIRPIRSLRTPAEEDDLRSFTEAEAIRLFEDRASAVRPDFEVNEHNARAVAAICRRLDGIPLAIELAAARVTSMGPLEISARLDRDFRFLRSGRRTAVERHRTLHAAVDWSYRMLSTEEQQVFERASVFAGGFSLAAAESVCGEGVADVAEVVDGLVAKSLVNAELSEEGTRYWMLETMRQYALDKLVERDDGDATRDAHLAWFLELAIGAERGVTGRDERKWMRLIGTEIDNLQAAHEWAVITENTDAALRMTVGLQWYGGARVRSASNEILDTWAPRALALPGAERHELAPLVYGFVSAGATARGDLTKAHELAERGLALAPDTEDPRRLKALSALAAMAIFEGQLEEAMSRAEQAIHLARLGNDNIELARWSMIRAMIAGYAGDRDSAARLLDEARLVEVESPSWRALQFYTAGESILDADPPAAIEFLDQAVDIAREMQHDFIFGVARLSAISLRGRHFDVYEAIAGYPEIIEGWRMAGNHTQQWATLRNLAEHFAKVGRDAAAVTLFGAAESSGTAAPMYGEHGERQLAVLAAAEERLGSTVASAARAQGAHMGYDDAVAFALDEIRSALAAREETASVT